MKMKNNSPKKGVTTVAEWQSWCRLCAKNTQKYLFLIVKDANNDIVRAVWKYLNIDITLDNGLSSNLCTECHDFLYKWILFADHVQKVQKMFQDLQSADSNVNVNILRENYGLQENLWTHLGDISKPNNENLEGILDCDNQLEQQEFVAVEENGLGIVTVEQYVIAEQVPEQPSNNSLPSLSDSPKNLSEKPSRKRCAARKVKLKSKKNDTKEPIPGSRETQKKAQGDNLNNSSKSAVNSSKINGPVECQECHNLYKHRASLRKHLKIGCKKANLREKLGPNRTCKLCNKTFTKPYALKTHMRYVHEDLTPFICDICGVGQKSLGDLNKHKLVHTDERPCICEICKAAFKNENRLKTHMEIHGEPSYECDKCGKKLQTRVTFNQHMRVHAGERKFKCGVCGLGFNYRTVLKGHLLSHTGLRPYVCKYCKKTYATKRNCRAHQMKKHPKEVANEGERGQSPSRLSVPSLVELRVMATSITKEPE